MSEPQKGLVDVIDIKHNKIIWSLFHRHTAPRYLFAENHDREEIKQRILSSHRIKDAIEKHKNEEQVDVPAVHTKVSRIVDEISHAFSMRTIRFMICLILNSLKKIFKQVLVNEEGIEMFRECSLLSPVVLVPTHNSYFDFILISYICFVLNLPLPAIVAGQDFLGMAVVNRLLRGSGAFYMRRSFASDSFYRSVFTEYVQQVLCLAERPIEFFLEGTRSRCGKALHPKVGLLSMVLESFFHGFVPDVSFIPISMSFEKITEEQLYTLELLGIPKPKESSLGLLKARSVLNTDYGTVSVHFGKVMTLKEYCVDQINVMEYVNIPRCERHLKIFGREVDEMKIAKYFGQQLVHSQQSNMTVFPRAPVAAYMLQNLKKKPRLSELARVVDRIGLMLSMFKCRLLGFQELLTDEKHIRRAVQMSELVLKIDDGNTVSYDCTALVNNTPKQRNDLSTVLGDLESDVIGYVYLSRQRNKLAHSCLLACLFVKGVRVADGRLERCKGIFSFLCDLMQEEFIFELDKTPAQLFESTLELLQRTKYISVNDSILTINPERHMEIEFLIGLLQPFCDAYMIVVQNLLTHEFTFPTTFKPITASLQVSLVESVKLYQLGTFEALSLHTLSNILTYLTKTGQLYVTKNERFETLISGLNHPKLRATLQRLVSLVSVCLHVNSQPSKL